MDLEKEFQNSINLIKNIENIDNDDMLILYGLYKQITEGDCSTPQPWSFQTIYRSRWEAWYRNIGLQRSIAIQKYIEKVNEIVKKVNIL